MLLVRTYVARSNIHGCGVFAAEPISMGNPVWEFNAIIDTEITDEQIARLPVIARESVLTHSFINGDGRMILSRDNAIFFNHSTEPNTKNIDGINTALRDIAVGEELTEDYRHFPIGACSEFLSHAAPSEVAGGGEVRKALE
jgi:SET domain-containing protein